VKHFEQLLIHRFQSPIDRISSQLRRFGLDHLGNPIYLCFINIKQQKKMKATITILAAVLVLHAGILFAGNDNSSTTVAAAHATITMVPLAPVTPAEATFEEIAVSNAITALVPVTPSEASFEDMPFEMVSISDLTPVVPLQADFE
jgi:hypothetical protein